MLTIPETLSSQVLLNKAKRIRRLQISGYENIRAPVEDTDRSLTSIFKVALTRPWIILFDPISFFVAIYLSVVYTLLYMLFTIYPIVFQQKRGWNAGVGELPLIGTVIGACIGGGIVFYVSARDKRKIMAGHKGVPEDRLVVAMIGGILFPVCMFWFAWTANFNSIHWVVPTIAGVFLSTSILLIFVAYLNYLTDSYLMYAASALAANTVCRSACGAAAPLFTQYMFDALGVGGGGSLIGGVASLLAVIPFLFYRYGRPIRERSPFAPTEPAAPEGDDAAANSTETNPAGATSTEEHDEEEETSAEDATVRGSGRTSHEEQEKSRDGADPYLNASGMEKAEI
ncbi:hypothetical protein ANO11243_091850 [Dothideomycetidae sp. 11243]|nr:hypothetical protein ANO11243_091850 [fungal sp. No.11243]